MFELTVKNEYRFERVQKAADRAQRRQFRQTAFAIMRSARESIEQRPGPSPPGDPPHTHRRVFLRRAIRYWSALMGAVIGPIHSIVGAVGEAHEFGRTYKETDFPARPFMGPALETNFDRFARGWSGSIGE